MNAIEYTIEYTMPKTAKALAGERLVGGVPVKEKGKWMVHFPSNQNPAIEAILKKNPKVPKLLVSTEGKPDLHAIVEKWLEDKKAEIMSQMPSDYVVVNASRHHLCYDDVVYRENRMSLGGDIIFLGALEGHGEIFAMLKSAKVAIDARDDARAEKNKNYIPYWAIPGAQD